MTDKQPKPSPQPLLTLPVVDVPHAPIVFFDMAPNFGNGPGVVHVTLAAWRHLPDNKGGTTSDLVVSGYLRCSVPAAISLRDAINNALLMGVAPADGGQNN